jgi:DNA-binding HxlR family transcriptional regulator
MGSMVCVTLSESDAEERDVHSCDAALVRAFTFLGKRWNGVILASLGAGSAGFADLRRRVGMITDSVLSDRLTELSKVGLVDRVVDAETRPPAVRYALTSAGVALLPVFDELATWAHTNLPPDRC